jgi:hypothetical protein
MFRPLAWKDGNLVGTYRTLEGAIESLAWRERLETGEEFLGGKS